jgi:uncharacterized membrane protein YfcA
MAFISFPLIIIFLSVILAVWWLIKRASPPTSVKDEPQSTEQLTVRTLLWIITGVYTLALIPACFMATMSMMGPPGSFGLDIIVMASFPITIFVSVVSAWILYRGGKFNLALLLILLPIAQLVVSYFVPGIWSAR